MRASPSQSWCGLGDAFAAFAKITPPAPASALPAKLNPLPMILPNSLSAPFRLVWAPPVTCSSASIGSSAVCRLRVISDDRDISCAPEFRCRTAPAVLWEHDKALSACIAAPPHTPEPEIAYFPAQHRASIHPLSSPEVEQWLRTAHRTSRRTR